jgi:DNA-binding NarL/FixJ family response regulator
MNTLPLRRSRILVAHEDPLLCAGLVAALRQHSHFDVFLDGVDPIPDGPASIDVVIADYSHAMRIADVAERAARGLRQARILALTANDREADVRRAVEAGIHGYLLVGGPLDELIDAVATVAKGLRHLCPAVAQRMADSLSHASLTARELDVLQLVALGESNKAIARGLRIEVGTVKSHMTAIMTKLGAMSRTQAAGIAAIRGLVDERLAARTPALGIGDGAPGRAARTWSLSHGGEHAHA